VLSGSSGAAGRLALDCFGRDWGWRRGGGDWDGLMKAAARGRGPELQQEAGLTLWQQLDAAAAGPKAQLESGLSLHVSHRQGPGCRWHPPCLWLGIGCERDTSLSLLVRAVDQALSEHQLAPQAVAGLASVDRKGDEPALLALAQQRGWPLRLFGATSLAPVAVPTPSLAVEKEMGTASVAEAAALLAAGPEASLLVNKRIERAASAALGLDVGPEGRQSRGPPPWRSPRPPANGRPPRGTSTSLAVAQAASICSLPTPARPWPSARSGWATGSISTCLSRCGDPTSGAATANSPRNANAVPRPWIWPARA